MSKVRFKSRPSSHSIENQDNGTGVVRRSENLFIGNDPEVQKMGIMVYDAEGKPVPKVLWIDLDAGIIGRLVPSVELKGNKVGSVKIGGEVEIVENIAGHGYTVKINHPLLGTKES